MRRTQSRTRRAQQIGLDQTRGQQDHAVIRPSVTRIRSLKNFTNADGEVDEDEIDEDGEGEAEILPADDLETSLRFLLYFHHCLEDIVQVPTI